MKNEIGRTIDTNYLKIYGNCLEFKDTSIQLSNVSLFSTVDIAPSPFPVWSILVILVGVFALQFNALFAILLIAAGGGWIYYWYHQYQKTKELKKLMIATNSGNIFTIVFNDQAFLNQVVQVLNAVLSDPVSHANITVDVKGNAFMDVSGNTFHDSASVVQHMNEFSGAGKQ